jgi:hypothetical protein
MKVRELQERLGRLDPELDMLCYCEDEKLISKGRGFVLLEIAAISTAEAESLRLSDGTPYLKFDKSPMSAPLAILEVTSDF